MSTENSLPFQDLTAWFSNSVSRERKYIWKKLGGKEASFDTAQFIYSENAESTDTLQIFQSEQYQDEHLAVFHAKYISDCSKSKNQEIPVGKYFMPPKEIQNMVREQMDLIWDNIDSGVSSDAESMPDLDLQKTPQKNSESKQDKKQTPQTSVKQRQNNRTTDNLTPLTSQRQNATRPSEPILECQTQGQNSKRTAKSPAKSNKQCPEDQQHILHSTVSPSKVQKQGQKSAESPSTSRQRKSPRKSTDLLPSESIQRKTVNVKHNYNLRKITLNSYSDTTALNVDNIVLDNVETVDRQHSTDRQSTNRLDNHTEGFFCIEDLAKVTMEVEHLDPGQNDFEIFSKK